MGETPMILTGEMPVEPAFAKAMAGRLMGESLGPLTGTPMPRALVKAGAQHPGRGRLEVIP